MTKPLLLKIDESKNIMFNIYELHKHSKKSKLNKIVKILKPNLKFLKKDGKIYPFKSIFFFYQVREQ